MPGVGGGQTGRGAHEEQQLLYIFIVSLSQPQPSLLPQPQELLSRKKRLSAMVYLLLVKDYGEEGSLASPYSAVHFIHKEMKCYNLSFFLDSIKILCYNYLIIWTNRLWRVHFGT